jgi:hypothetical protein
MPESMILGAPSVRLDSSIGRPCLGCLYVAAPRAVCPSSALSVKRGDFFLFTWGTRQILFG